MTTNKQITLFLIGVLISFSYWGQPAEKRISRENYIEIWKEEAVQQMIKYKIPASITLAQGILESANGNSSLAKYGNNHFGIKCHNWDGEGIYKDDDKKNECFRKYNDANESFEDHSLFLANRSRYATLFDLKTTDYKGWAKGLKKAGYATNPKYADLLIALIEENELYVYDEMLLTADRKDNNNEYSAIESAVLAKPSLNQHHILVHENKIKYIKVKEGDTFYKIAKEFDLALWQLYKYNNLDNKSYIQVGDVLFLQPKRGKSSKRTHVVKKGDTVESISQLYGVKTKSIRRKNKLDKGAILTPGQQIRLK